MFNVGPGEIAIIAVGALLVFGPKRLPDLAKSMGKGIRDFKKALEGGGQEEEKNTSSDNESSKDTASLAPRAPQETPS